jgi:hypothetical protein
MDQNTRVSEGEEVKEEADSEGSESSLLNRFQRMNLVAERIWPGPFSPLSERQRGGQEEIKSSNMGNQDVHMETVNPLLQTMKNEGIPDQEPTATHSPRTSEV